MRRHKPLRHAAVGALALVTPGILGVSTVAATPSDPAVVEVSPAAGGAPNAAPTATGSAAVTPVTETQATTGATPTTTAAAPTTTAPVAAAPVAAGPPVVRNLKLPATISARQGHARFLVGVRLSAPATVTAQIFDVKGNRLVRTVSTDAAAPGRVYMLIEATSEQRYQLPAGRYRIAVQATDAQKRTSGTLAKIVTLTTTAPRGRLDMDLVSLWSPLARSLKLPAQGGQLVGAAVPKGEAVKAGIRRGDVVISINGLPTLTPGQLANALRALPANQGVPIEFRRGTKVTKATLTASPDWTPVGDMTRAYVAGARRSPTLGIAVARALYAVRIGKAADAAKQYASWPKGWKRSAPGQLVDGRIQEARKQPKQALGAYNRALARDKHLGEAATAKATILSARNQNAAASKAFAQAVAIDPKDATAAAYEVFSLVREKRYAEALAPARKAVAIDATSGEAQIALGLALVLNKQPARGVVALRSGVVLTDNTTLAQQVIDQYLEPNDK